MKYKNKIVILPKRVTFIGEAQHDKGKIFLLTLNQFYKALLSI